MNLQISYKSLNSANVDYYSENYITRQCFKKSDCILCIVRMASRPVINNMNIKLTLLVLSAVIFVIPVESFAQSSGSIEVFVKNENGDRVPSDGLSVKVFRDQSTIPLRDLSVRENPLIIDSLQTNQHYKVEVYANSMYAGVGFVDLKTPYERVEITIKNSGGMRLGVFYKDGSTPLQNVDVVIKSHDGSVWSQMKTDSSGNTLRVWLHPTMQANNHYFAEVTLAKGITYTTQPLKLQPGVAQEFKVVTDWPTVVDKLITVEVYASPTHKVSRQDGLFVAELYDRGNNKIAESNVIGTGLAYFSNLKVNNYYLYIKSKNLDGSTSQIASKLVTITATSDNIKIYINNPELNSDHINCNCVAFRLDDIQDFFLAPSQIAVISTFEKKQAPLTIGVIGGSFGTDSGLVNAIRERLAGGMLLEVANHSWNNRILTQLPKEVQAQLINDTNEKIRSILKINATTFIPPENLFNDDTIDVLKSSGFTHMSSDVLINEPPPFVKSEFYQFHAITHTAKLDPAKSMWNPTPNKVILDKINESMFDYGYAVVMMHPYEFSSYENGYTNKVNATQIAQLEQLIDEIKARNIKILPIGMIQDFSSELPVPTVPVLPTDPPHADVFKSCNCVAFRLDNVQDFWLNSVQNTVIDTFTQTRSPLTITVIGKSIGEDPIVVDEIKKKLNNTPQLRLASKGWEHVDHTQFDTERQAASIEQTNQRIFDIFGVRPAVFSPPFDRFNDDTLEALRRNGMTYLTASTLTDRPPFKGDIMRVPSTVYFSDAITDDPFLEGTISQKALYKVESGVRDYGFAVVGLQASDFAVRDGEFKNEVDESKIALLRSLISDVRSHGMTIIILDRIPALISNTVSISEQTKGGIFGSEQITDTDLARGLGILADRGVLKTPAVSEKSIPSWILNNAKWWAAGQITDSDFINGMQYLIDAKILRI
jgi:peptidoglycan/xylan/chitin deacetylase (PgdA/CDA1 family)